MGVEGMSGASYNVRMHGMYVRKVQGSSAALAALSCSNLVTARIVQ